jgi:hypothetical protein
MADYEAACRLLTYIYSTPDYGILFTVAAGSLLRIYTDASHALHGDGKGHGGMIMTLGSGYIFAKSGKLKCVTLSSTESESVVMCEAATYVVWIRGMMDFFGCRFEQPTRMYQDNLSAIWLATNDGSFSKNKHTLVKRAYLMDKVKEQIIVPVHMDTERMPADMLTKSMNRKLLTRHMERIGMIRLN